MNNSEPIEQYLDELQSRLHGDARQIRRIVCEAESHLYDAAGRHERAGASPAESARLAIREFGSVHRVAEAQRTGSLDRWRVLALRSGWQAGPLVAVGLLAIGVSGLVARGLVAVMGSGQVFADAPGTRYPAADCRYWLSIHPRAAGCTAAYLAESTADNLMLRYACGVLGLILATALVVAGRRGFSPRPAVPTLALDLAAAVAFLAIGTLLGVLALDRDRLASGAGAGQWWSAAMVAVPFGLAFLVRSAVALRNRQETAALDDSGTSTSPS